MVDDYEDKKKKKRKIKDDREDDIPGRSFDEFLNYLTDNLKKIMPNLEEFFTQIQDKINSGEIDPEDFSNFNELDNFDFGKIFMPQNMKTTATISEPAPKDPLIDVMDIGDKIKIIIDLPGLEKEDIKLNLKKNSVLVSVHKRKLHKRIPLISDINKEHVSATYKNGILEITLNKA